MLVPGAEMSTQKTLLACGASRKRGVFQGLSFVSKTSLSRFATFSGNWTSAEFRMNLEELALLLIKATACT